MLLRHGRSTHNLVVVVAGTRRVAATVGTLSQLHPSSTQTKPISSSSSPSSLPHDIGGQEAYYGPIDVAGLKQGEGKGPDYLQAWEQQCHALFVVLATKKIVGTDQLRAAVEGLTATQYHTWSYYEKWSAAMTSLLLQAGVISRDELRLALFGKDVHPEKGMLEAPRFAVHDKVRVRSYDNTTAMEWQRPHIRTPGYIYGVAGRIERYTGAFPDPSFLAFGWPAPEQHLYRVKFRLRDVWPEQHNPSSSSPSVNHDAADTAHEDWVEVELYEHWLEPSDVDVGHAYQGQKLFNHHTHGDDCLHHDHGSHGDKDHLHGNQHHHQHHGDHVHEARPLVEQRAIDREGPPRPGQQLHQTLMKVLLEKGVVSSNEVRLVTEKMDTAGKQLDGAALVVAAWSDPEFRERLLADPPAAAREIGIETANPNAPTVLSVVPNTPTTHNLVVCTLCSCYPSGLLGIAPAWYKSREFRSRAVREPRRVLAHDFGLDVSHKPTIRVHDSTADHRYLVLPERPAGTEDWSNEALRALVTRDTMIGVADIQKEKPEEALPQVTQSSWRRDRYSGGFVTMLLFLALLVPPAFSSRDALSLSRGGARYPEENDKSSIFSTIVRQSSRAIAATARGSTKVAADLVRPKEVAWEELVGWWHLDLALENEEAETPPPLTVHITPDRHVQWTTADGIAHDYVVEFRRAAWPRSARLKFGTSKFYYQCTVQRKLANLNILKLRGKMYATRRFQGKVQIGSFVGRRRIIVIPDAQESDEYDKYNEEEYDEDHCSDNDDTENPYHDDEYKSEETNTDASSDDNATNE